MNFSADIEWLQRKWKLPDDATPHVAALLAAERTGSTAVMVPAEFAELGPAIGTAEDAAPLVRLEYEGETFLQSRRLFALEEKIAGRILARTGEAVPLPDLDAQLDALFPNTGTGDTQVHAARLAVSHRLAIITGGPGTGKTHTLARILALLASREISPDLVRLAAPTGKAADRMKTAVIDSLATLPPEFAPLHADLLRIAESSSTIHSLIGYHPGVGRSRFDAKKPVPCSTLIVDECSMIDVTLWHELLGAIPDDCRLVLLGDPHQLESVGQGNVFAELARAASLVGSRLHAHHAHLSKGWRFRENSGIRAFAQALENSDAGNAVAILESAATGHARDGLAWLDLPHGQLTPAHFPDSIRTELEAVATAETPAAALDALSRVCILTAQREFFVGARATSETIEAWFSEKPGTRNHPIIINRNDPETGLRNGAVGVIHQEEDGGRKAWFRSAGKEPRSFSLAKLPDFTPAWAITIHRSQGSEYDNVLVVLPQEESPLATRALLYTAITRARKSVFVAGSLSTVRKAVATPSARTTLLAYHLQSVPHADF